MITEAVGDWFLYLVAGVFSLLPDTSPEQEASWQAFGGHLSEVVDYISKFGPIVPFEQIGIAAVVLSAAALTALSIQGARIVASFVTLGGGAL